MTVHNNDNSPEHVLEAVRFPPWSEGKTLVPQWDMGCVLPSAGTSTGHFVCFN